MMTTIFEFLLKNSIFSNSQQNGLHTTHIHLLYEHNNKNVILDLHLNDNLIPIEHFMSYQLPNGDKAIKNFTKTDIDLCHYHVSTYSHFFFANIFRNTSSSDGNDRHQRLKMEFENLCYALAVFVTGQNTKQSIIKRCTLNMRRNKGRRV